MMMGEPIGCCGRLVTETSQSLRQPHASWQHASAIQVPVGLESQVVDSVVPAARAFRRHSDPPSVRIRAELEHILHPIEQLTIGWILRKRQFDVSVCVSQIPRYANDSSEPAGLFVPYTPALARGFLTRGCWDVGEPYWCEAKTHPRSRFSQAGVWREPELP